MIDKGPFFSVIIPTRNRSGLLDRAIKSVINQSFSRWELIIVDDGSTDDTRHTVRKFQDHRIKYFYKKHEERSSARNWGIKKAKAPYICFLDDDDYYLAQYLSDFYDEYKTANKEIILRTGFLMAHKGRFIKRAIYNPTADRHPVNWAAENMCGVWTLAIPRKFLKENQFDVRFPHWQDTHLILRLFHKYPVKQLPGHNYVYVIHPKMGSKLYDRPDALHRINLNIDAIKDLFDRYPHIANLFDYDVRSQQIAHKWAQHFINALIYKKFVLAIKILRPALSDSSFKFLYQGAKELLRNIKNLFKIANK